MGEKDGQEEVEVSKLGRLQRCHHLTLVDDKARGPRSKLSISHSCSATFTYRVFGLRDTRHGKFEAVSMFRREYLRYNWLLKHAESQYKKVGKCSQTAWRIWGLVNNAGAFKYRYFPSKASGRNCGFIIK